MTDKPFGVNMTVLPSIKLPPYAECMQVIIESGIRILETAGNNPRDMVPKFKQHGITVVHKCTSARHALSAQKHSVDVISIDGIVCAGHPGGNDATNLILIPARVPARHRLRAGAQEGQAAGRDHRAGLRTGIRYRPRRDPHRRDRQGRGSAAGGRPGGDRRHRRGLRDAKRGSVGEIVEICFVIDLPDLGGRKRLEDKGYKVFTQCEFEGE